MGNANEVDLTGCIPEPELELLPGCTETWEIKFDLIPLSNNHPACDGVMQGWGSYATHDFLVAAGYVVKRFAEKHELEIWADYSTLAQCHFVLTKRKPSNANLVNAGGFNQLMLPASSS